MAFVLFGLVVLAILALAGIGYFGSRWEPQLCALAPMVGARL